MRELRENVQLLKARLRSVRSQPESLRSNSNQTACADSHTLNLPTLQVDRCVHGEMDEVIKLVPALTRHLRNAQTLHSTASTSYMYCGRSDLFVQDTPSPYPAYLPANAHPVQGIFLELEDE